VGKPKNQTQSKCRVQVSVSISTWSACMSQSSAKRGSGPHMCELLKALRTCALKSLCPDVVQDHSQRLETCTPSLTTLSQLLSLTMRPLASAQQDTATSPSPVKPMDTPRELSSLWNAQSGAHVSKQLFLTLQTSLNHNLCNLIKNYWITPLLNTVNCVRYIWFWDKHKFFTNFQLSAIVYPPPFLEYDASQSLISNMSTNTPTSLDTESHFWSIIIFIHISVF